MINILRKAFNKACSNYFMTLFEIVSIRMTRRINDIVFWNAAKCTIVMRFLRLRIIMYRASRKADFKICANEFLFE